MLLDLTFLIFAILINQIYSQTICYNPTSNCFDPSITQTLLFQYGQYTSCSRVSPIYKLNCIDANTPESSGLCTKYSKLITNIKCVNSGTDDSNNVIWKCEGILPSDVALGSTTVSCEGCTSPSDKLKITGSCGIFYQLVKKTISTPIQKLISTSKTDKTNKNSSNLTNGFIIFICFILGSILLICLIKCILGESPEYLPIYSNNSRRQYYNQIPSAERVVIPEIIPLTTEQTNVSINPSTNPYYIPNSPNRINVNIPQYRSYQTQSNIEMGNLSYRQQAQTDSSSLLSGYLVGKNLEEGNLGIAYLASTIGGGSGNNYSTGLLMGMFSGSDHSHNSHNSHKSRHNSHHKNSKLYESSFESSYEPSYNPSYQKEQILFDNSETYADTTTR